MGFAPKLSWSQKELHDNFDELVEWTCLRELEISRYELAPGAADTPEFIAARLGRMALVELRLRGILLASGPLVRLVSSPHLGGLEVLDFRNCGLERTQFALLAASLASRRLRSLSLARNPLGRGGFADLLWAQAVGPLEQLDLFQTGIGLPALSRPDEAGRDRQRTRRDRPRSLWKMAI